MSNLNEKVSPITTQAQLAKAVGVTPQWLSYVRHKNNASSDLLDKLFTITGIQPIYWTDPSKKYELIAELDSFYSKQKDSSIWQLCN